MKRFKHVLNTGTVAGLLAFAYFLVLYLVFGVNPKSGLAWFTVIIPAVLMPIGVKRHREAVGGGYLTFGQAFGAGVVFTFIYASLSAMLILLYGTLVDGGFVDLYVQDNLEQLGKTKDMVVDIMGRELYEEMLSEVKSASVNVIAFGDFQTKLIGTTIIALIVAGILKKRPPIETTEA